MTIHDLGEVANAAICATLCTALIFIPIIALRIRSNIQEAGLFRAAQARGAFADLNEEPTKSRIRIYASIGLAGGLGMLITFSILILRILDNDISRGYQLFAAPLIFGAISSVAGILLYREYRRRL
jgi:hypothetical protein